MSIKTKFEKINLEKLKSDSPQAYNILNGWATSTKNFTDDTANEVVEPLFNKLYDKLASGKFWYVIEGNKQPSDQVAEPITKKEEVAIVKEVIKSEPTPIKKDEPKTKSVKAKATKTHTASTKPKHTPTPPKMDGKSVFEIAKELRAKDSTLTQKEAVKKAGQMVKDAHKKVKDDELQALMKMIKSDPAYSVLKPEKNTSIIRDLGRPAIRTTKRVSKKGWKNQYGASEGGRTYYENRVNRMDVNKTPMYAKGGSIGYEGQSIYLNSVPSPKEDRFLETEIVIEKIEGNKIVKSFVRKTGEKVPFIIDSKFKVEQYAKGGMMAKGGKSDMFYVGQSIFYPITNNRKLDKSVRNFTNKYAERELVIEKINDGKPYNTAKVFDRKTGDKLPFEVSLNPKYVQQYADGGIMGDYDPISYAKMIGRDSQDYETMLKEYAGEHYDSLTPMERESMIEDMKADFDRSQQFSKGGSIDKFQVGDKVKFSVPYFESSLGYRGEIIQLKGNYAVVEYLEPLHEITLRTTIELDQLNKYAKGGSVEGKMSFEEFEETLQEYEKEGGFGKTLEKGYIMNYLPKNDPYLNVKFNHRNKRKAYKQYLEMDKFAKGGSVRGKHLPTSEVEYARKLKIDKLVIDGKEVSEDDIVSGVFFKKSGQKSTKSEGIRSWYVKHYSSDELGTELDGDITFDDLYTFINEEGGDFYKYDGDFYKYIGVGDSVIRERLFEQLADIKGVKYEVIYKMWLNLDKDKYAKGGKVGKFDAYEVEEKLADLSYGVWNKLGIDSGSEIYESDAIQKDMAKEYMMAGIDKMFLEYNAEQRKVIAEILSHENQHSLRNYLALRGYIGEDEKAEYVRLAKKYNVGKKRIVLNPSNIPNTPSNSSATSPKSGSKAGYFYVPKSEIVSIDYTKDGESHTAKNTDILDGAYVKISALKYAKGGRLPKDEVVYVPKAEIEEIMVSDSGFKVKDVTEELLSGIHLKSSALSPKSEPKKSSGTFGTTRVYKGYNGWIGRTSAYNVDGTDYEITTMKRSNGKLWSNAQSGKFERGMFTYMVFQSPNINLIETKPSKVTEKAVSEQHDKAIEKFKEIKGL
jgi:hypothetical protein